MSDFTIYIPTLHRTKKQRSFEYLPESWRDRIFLVTVEEDVEDLRKNYPEANTIVPPKEVKGISKVRQWIIENAETRYVWMCDDDQHFYKRLPNDWHLKYVSDKEHFNYNPMEDLLNETAELISKEKTKLGNKFFGVGLSARQGNNRMFPQTHVYNSRMYNTYALDTYLFKKEGIRFDEFEVMEDFNVTLSFLTRGYPNVIMYEYCWGQIESNMAGGCSEYRTQELQRKNAERLVKKFPRFVTLIEKKSKSWGGDFSTRSDVRVQWKKAFESAKLNKRTLF